MNWNYIYNFPVHLENLEWQILWRFLANPCQVVFARYSILELALQFHFSSMRLFEKFRITDSAKFGRQFMSSSFSSRNVRQSWIGYKTSQNLLFRIFRLDVYLKSENEMSVLKSTGVQKQLDMNRLQQLTETVISNFPNRRTLDS